MFSRESPVDCGICLPPSRYPSVVLDQCWSKGRQLQGCRWHHSSYTLGRKQKKKVGWVGEMVRVLCARKFGKKKNIDERPKNDEDNSEDKDEHRNSDNETEVGSASNTECDQDSDDSFSEENEEEIDKMEIEEEDWIEFIKRSTREAEEQMKNTEG